jgi:hypothetical protein
MNKIEARRLPKLWFKHNLEIPWPVKYKRKPKSFATPSFNWGELTSPENGHKCTLYSHSSLNNKYRDWFEIN